MSGDLNLENQPPVSERDVARACHRIVRSMHDGHCPQCGFMAPSELFQKMRWGDVDTRTSARLITDGHRCPECKFETTLAQEKAALEMFRPYFLESLDIFKEWAKTLPKHD